MMKLWTAASIALIPFSAFAKSKLTSRLFQSADGRMTIKVTSPDQLELTTSSGQYVCRYSRDGSSLRVVIATLGSVKVLMLEPTAEGLRAADGTILYDELHFGRASKKSGLLKSAVFTPRPEYPYEARQQKKTGSGVVLMKVDVASGVVLNASMEKSTGSPILDKATISAYRRWKFAPGAGPPIVRMPITYTMTGAQF